MYIPGLGVNPAHEISETTNIMPTPQQLQEAKQYLKLKILEGMFEEELFSILDENELFVLYAHTKEREEAWKNL